MEIRMGIYLNPGNEEFQKALNSKIYVDKTMLISEMNQNLNTEHQNIFQHFYDLSHNRIVHLHIQFCFL